MRSFPFAQRGINQVFKAAILLLFSDILMISGIALSVIASTLNSEPAFDILIIISMICIVVGVILSIVAFIMNLVGLKNAGEEEPSLRTAFVLSVVALLFEIALDALLLIPNIENVAIIGPFLQTLSNSSTMINDIIEIFVMIFVVTGTANLLNIREEYQLSNKGSSTAAVIGIAFALSTFCKLFMKLNTSSDYFTTSLIVVVAIVALIFAIIAYVKYLTFLGKAKNRLA